ncbi:PREDICTED: gamma-aminobutyric acid type B receptor subunit 1-like [Priapulus caudatus]|uniref:Gamma-aminobutyric acid type B receptor subunit 1-like n=1 Tax=Priapulus caudatus TaxID=37621 RepID=A0ABM1F5Y4_PRICU|nr:PREDICTED: gamma-aminobutyric acid type B receptor subunit 1-like [Priapulus caudatus]
MVRQVWIVMQAALFVSQCAGRGDIVINDFPKGPAPEGVVDLHIAGLFPMEGAWPGGQTLVPATELALSMINNRSDILPGYRLVIHWINDKCWAGLGVHGLHELIFNDTNIKVLVIGAGCSPVSQATAEVSHYWNLVQISPSSVAPSLSDRKRFPLFFRTATAEDTMNNIRIELMKHLNWKRVSIMQEALEIFTTASEPFVQMLAENNFTLQMNLLIQSGDDPRPSIEILQRNDVRIIFGGFYPERATRVFCEAYKLGFYGPKIQWILVGWYDDNWWDYQDPSLYNCTLEQVFIAMDGYLATGAVFFNPLDEVSIAGITSRQYRQMFSDYTNGRILPGIRFAGWAFDCIWAAALSLNKTDGMLASLGQKMRHFYHLDEATTNMIFDNMANIDFTGTMGRVRFDKSGSALGLQKIAQFQGRKIVAIGVFEEEGQRIEEGIIRPFVWRTPDRAPYDGKQVYWYKLVVNKQVYIGMCLLAVCGVILTLGFLIFNVTCRACPIVKMSSPTINNLILMGCVLNYSVVFFAHTSTRSEPEQILAFCMVHNVLLAAGFSLGFGALFAKTWRVHVIFTSVQQNQRKVIKDRKLVFMVLMLVGVNIAILVTWEIIDPKYIVQSQISEQSDMMDADIVYHAFTDTCTSSREMYFISSIYCVLGLLLIVGAVLAWETRQVKVEALNDSQLIGICIYNAVVLSVMGVAVAFVLTDQPSLRYALLAGFIIIGTTFTSCLIFVPKPEN